MGERQLEVQSDDEWKVYASRLFRIGALARALSN
jgi:hypothetical protein